MIADFEAQCVLGDDRLFITAGYGSGCGLLRVQRDGDKWSAGQGGYWHKPTMRCKFTSPVLYKGLVYGLDEGMLACVDPADVRVVLAWLDDGNAIPDDDIPTPVAAAVHHVLNPDSERTVLPLYYKQLDPDPEKPQTGANWTPPRVNAEFVEGAGVVIGEVKNRAPRLSAMRPRDPSGRDNLVTCIPGRIDHWPDPRQARQRRPRRDGPDSFPLRGENEGRRGEKQKVGPDVGSVDQRRLRHGLPRLRECR